MKTISKEKQSRAIVEIVGAPKEYVAETIRSYVDKIDETAKVKLVKVTFEEPTEERKLWSTFADIEFMVKTPEALIFFCFDYMPASIEIMQPEELTYRSTDFTAFFNDFMARLHKVDLLVKDLTAKNKALLRNSNLILRNMVVLTLAYNGPLQEADLADKVGISAKQLQPFLKTMTDEGWLAHKAGKYENLKDSKALDKDKKKN
jgi:hypothetical protein